MPSAYDIFAGGTETRHKALKMLWPELFDALRAKAAVPGAATRVRPCELRIAHPHGDRRPPAVARISAGGPAACQGCLDRLNRDGRHPLEYAELRNE